MATKKKAAAKKAPAKKAAAKKATKVMPKRDDFGAPVDGFFAKTPSPYREILEGLRALILEVAPTAEGALKWGAPLYSVNGAMLCALQAHKAHVNLIISGAPELFVDPKGLLTGEGKTGRHLKLTSAADIPKADIKKWLRASIKAKG